MTTGSGASGTAEYLAGSTSTPVYIRLAMVLGHTRPERVLVKSPYHTRCVRSGEVHELIAVRREDLRGDKYSGASYLGFAEVTASGVLHVGQIVTVADRALGTLAGFDYTHYPNHLNLLIETPDRQHGRSLGLCLNQTGAFATTDSPASPLCDLS